MFQYAVLKAGEMAEDLADMFRWQAEVAGITDPAMIDAYSLVMSGYMGGVAGKQIAAGARGLSGVGRRINILRATNKADALKAVEKLPSNIQLSVKRFFKRGSNQYTDFSVNSLGNGNYMAKRTKPGDVPGSKAIYYKEIKSNGETVRVFKETYDSAGKLVHVKDK